MNEIAIAQNTATEAQNSPELGKDGQFLTTEELRKHFKCKKQEIVDWIKAGNMEPDRVEKVGNGKAKEKKLYNLARFSMFQKRKIGNSVNRAGKAFVEAVENLKSVSEESALKLLKEMKRYLNEYLPDETPLLESRVAKLESKIAEKDRNETVLLKTNLNLIKAFQDLQFPNKWKKWKEIAKTLNLSDSHRKGIDSWANSNNARKMQYESTEKYGRIKVWYYNVDLVKAYVNAKSARNVPEII